MLQRNCISLVLPTSHALPPRSSFLLASPPTTYSVDAAKVSSFSVCTDAWEYAPAGGSTAIYVCKGDNDPDLTQQVGTASFIAGPIGATNGANNQLYLVTEQFDINGCILQRIGTWDDGEDVPTNAGIWTTTSNNEGCPKPNNIADYDYASVSVGICEREMFTFTFKRPVVRTPLTLAKFAHSKE